MKTITARDFQLRHSSIVKDVAEGHEYEVTFHPKPHIKLIPMPKKIKKNPEPGSRDATIRSLQYAISSKGGFYDLPYNQLRGQILKAKIYPLI